MKIFLPTLYLFCITGILVFYTGCETPSPSDSPEPPDVVEPKDGIETIIPTGNEKYLNIDSDYIFDQNELHTFELTIPADHLAKIDADPSAEEYVEASLTFEGETISPVGVRYKGSIGAFVNCLSGTDWANPSGYKTCTKLSMKIKINWNGREDRFYGLRKVQLHSQNHDASQMRERLGYWLFRQMGVAAPRSVHARLMINGQYAGLYALTEQIDGRFTRYHFEDGKGNLYKEVWPLNYYGQPRTEEAYLSRLKTNEDENPSARLIRSFAQDIANSINTEELQAVINQWMDVPEIIAYAVVDRSIRADDGPFHWYCNGNVCSNHNYFWYEDPSAEKMHLIPWDLDNAFENIIFNQNPVTPIADAWGETRNNCKPFPHGNFQLMQRSAACDKLIAGWASFDTEYQQTLTAFRAGPFSEAQVNAKLNAWKAQIQAATLEASQAHEDAITVEEWETAFNGLKTALSFARIN